jgi:hypothetical protein
MIITRRHLFGLLAAPAIVRASSLMPISVYERALYLSPADYWRFANQMVPLFIRSVSSPVPKGFLNGISGFDVYMDPERASRRDARVVGILVQQMIQNSAESLN